MLSHGQFRKFIVPFFSSGWLEDIPKNILRNGLALRNPIISFTEERKKTSGAKSWTFESPLLICFIKYFLKVLSVD
jgi:hypothetical protein